MKIYKGGLYGVIGVCIGCSNASDLDLQTNIEKNNPQINFPSQQIVRQERLFIGTGEYSATDNWHAILRFDHAESINSDTDGPITPDATIPIKQLTDKQGVHLNFGHGIYHRQSTDEMFIASTFTKADNSECQPCDTAADMGSVGVLANVSTVDEAHPLERHIFGGDDPKTDATGIIQPHAVWLDESRDILYVANSFGKSLLAFEHASSVDGNTPYSRKITFPEYAAPIFVFVNSDEDRLWAAYAPMASPRQEPSQPLIALYNGASQLNGTVKPTVRIVGSSTRLSDGNNQTTHNVWYDPTHQMLIVGHHTNEILFFDLHEVNLDADGSTDYDLTPRVIDVSEDDSKINNYSVYGFFYLPDTDRLYVSTGYAENGPPVAGSPPNQVKVYDNVSSEQAAGRIPPSRTIQWTNGDVYRPPQPLWVDVE